MNKTSRDLAYAFAALLRSELEDEIQQVIALNQDEANQAICHSHDFIDANEVMADAFRQTFGREVDLQSDADGAIWNEAWRLAKESEFETDCVTDDERSNGPR